MKKLVILCGIFIVFTLVFIAGMAASLFFVLQIALTPLMLIFPEKTVFHKWMANIWISWDQHYLNVWTGGDPDETASSRMGKYLRGKHNCVLCKLICPVLDAIEKLAGLPGNHCQRSIDESEGRRTLTRY